jgi:hypothetical protein
VLALATVTLTTHVATAVHGAVAQHAYCEHGQLIDVEHDGGISKQPASSESPVRGASLRALVAPPGNHDHCALAAAPHGRTAFDHAAALVTPLDLRQQQPLRAADPLTHSIPLLALAPKGSPPLRQTLRG